MTDRTSSFDDRARLDRLVDGELSPDEYRDLLASLEREPDGWRQCALAFLEAQAWQTDLGACLTTPSASQPPSARQRPSRQPLHVAAIAASFLVAFALGLGARGWISSVTPPHTMADAVQPDGALAGMDSDARRPALPPAVRPDWVLANDAASTSNGDAISLPLYELNDERALDVLSRSMIPPHVRRSLNDMGYEVSEQRRFSPASSADGRPVLVPIDDVQIVPVSNRSY